jgi:hypothetical protein
MRGKRSACRLLVGKPERDSYGDQDVGGWIILGWIFGEVVLTGGELLLMR